MTSQVEKIVSIAEGEVGYHEGRSGGHWDNDQKYSEAVPGLEWSQNQAWCATFVSWLALEAGLDKLYPRTASCSTAVNWFKQRGRFSEYPAVGAQVFFGSGGGSHTGLVIGYDATYVYTIEGNTNDNGSAEGDGTYKKKRVRKDDYVYGYGYPEFDDGIVTADPSKKGEKGFTYKATASVDTTPAPPKEDPKPAPSKAEYEPYPGAAYFKKHPKSDMVTRMGKRLVAMGCSAYRRGPGPQWTESDRLSYRKWQLKLGYRGKDADGWPGKTSWDKLKVPKR